MTASVRSWRSMSMAVLDRRERRIVLAITSVGAMMGPLDSTIVSVSLPVISSDLGMDYAASVWIPTAYLLALASLLLTMGRLSDIRGRRNLFVLGFAIFVLGSLLCSISQNAGQIIAFRFLQGAGASIFMATSPAILTDAFPPQERGKALGINAMAVYIGLSLGPPLGGVLTAAFGWPSIFLVNVPIGLAVIALSLLYLKEPAREVRHRPFDVSGAIAFAVGLSALLVALTLGDGLGWTSPELVAIAAVAAAGFAAFLVIEHRRGADAMLDLRLFTSNRLFALANLSTLLNYTAYFGVSFLLSFYMQRVLGLSLYLTGLVLLSMPLVMSFLSPIMGWASDRVGSRVLASGGMALVGIGLLLLSTIDAATSITTLVAYLLVLGVGMGMFSSPNTSAIMGCVPRSQLGVASGTVSTMRTVGQSLSLVIMGAVVASVVSSAVVSDIFSGAAGTSVAAEEFVSGMSLAFIVSAGIAFIGALTSLARGTPETCERTSST
ncbi:MAG: MFS transporter [Methanomassiliicoccus sp.]|nr:MFS transporter [Methanomassiliicoccus sp.]